MSILPKSLQFLIEALGSLPGVGQRTAERYAYYLLRTDPATSSRLSNALDNLHSNVILCPITYALIEKGQTASPLYQDPSRNKQLVAVVAEPFDIVALERTGQYHGTYHVLGGLISPIDGIGPEQLHLPELAKRIKADKVSELILATNASVEGESTALFIKQQLDQPKLIITRLARGLGVGVDLEYADQITLARALSGRQKL